MSCIDWEKIKTEYVSGGTSYRKLAEKYGTTLSVLRSVAKKEHWVELKAQAQHKADTKLVNNISTKKAKTSEKIISVADKLLDKISSIIDLVEDTQGIKHLTSAIKDIKDIKGFKSDADLREQEARIRKLEMDAAFRQEDDDKPSGVVLMPPITEELKPPIKEDGNG